VTAPGLPTPEQIRERLEALRADRGFLLPHHGALAAAAPDLHDAYGTMYTALTLTERHLSPFEREFTWLALLIALREAVGTHHIALFRKAGGTDAQARLAFQLAGYATAANAFTFLAEHWAAEFPGIDPAQGYLAGVAALCGDTAAPVELAMLAVQAALGNAWGVAAHLRAAYAAAIPEDKLVEAMTLIIWPCGVNRFVAACTVWHELMRSRAVTPSPRFQAWADMPGQGAYARP
jgi:alkylhydroperoxidase/carboxymuconolactone decarboxylase family protein YurZ